MDDKTEDKGQVMKKIQKERIMKCFILAMFIAIHISLVYSEIIPEGPTDLNVINSSRRTPEQSKTLDAIAGNVSQIDIFVTTQTRTWQGYYGNVTGRFVLGDSQGNTIYDWDTVDPSGQIFASTSELSFQGDNIGCYNFSKYEYNYLNITALEASFGIRPDSPDGINETFNDTTAYEPFYVGTRYIDDICPVAYLYNSTNESSESTYQELLLYDNTANDVIFTSIIRPGGILGFDSRVWDFQMILADDGHGGDTDTTTYYFYIALQ